MNNNNFAAIYKHVCHINNIFLNVQKPNLDGREYSEQLGFWRLLPPQSIEVFFSQTGPLILEPVILVHLRLLVINLIHRM